MAGFVENTHQIDGGLASSQRLGEGCFIVDIDGAQFQTGQYPQVAMPLWPASEHSELVALIMQMRKQMMADETRTAQDADAQGFHGLSCEMVTRFR